jgi:YVTN family beta-propeller protein
MNLHSIQSFDSGIKSETFMKLARRIAYVAVVSSLMFASVATKAQEPARAAREKQTNSPVASVQKIVEQGIAIEFTLDPPKSRTQLMAGEDATVSFKVTDTTTRTPVKGLGLSVWMRLRGKEEEAPDARQCRETIQSFVQGSMRARPDVDLNSYYLLTLNKSADISVIDPLLSYGGSKLLTLVMLRSPGEDWVLSGDGEKLFVTMPLINQVAVIDTRSWRVTSYIDTGIKPTRIALQPDQKYLWVANDGNGRDPGSVTAIDTSTLKVVAEIATGAGHHETVISSDNRYVFISNQVSGTLSVIDVPKLAKIREINVGATPVSMALSPLSKAIYVASETEGTITVVDEQSQKIIARMKGKPGLRSVRFAPGGRYGFALNTKENTVHILDAATNRMLRDARIGKAPDQIMFSDTFAFVRSLGTESVAMIRLATIGSDVEVTEFPGGQAAPGKGSPPIRADSVVLAPEGNAVIVANPVDKVLYYYSEGMAAPMGNFQNYRREPLAVLVVDRSLRETTSGVYSTTVKLPAGGKYDVVFLADSPRITHCFEASAQPNPVMKEEQQVALRIEYQTDDAKLAVGRDFPFRFKLIDTATNKPKDDLKDVRVLTYSGSWQRRDIAKSLGNGIYEVRLNVPESGFYTMFVESASMGLRYRELPSATLQATDGNISPAALGQSKAAGKL